MKNDEFHISFIKNLVLVALTSVFLMFFSRVLVKTYILPPSNNQEFTSAQQLSSGN